MTPLPEHRPQKLTLGPLEAEILEILWDLEVATIKAIHARILADPDRELEYASVATVLRRLARKRWVRSDKADGVCYWQPLVSREQARALQAYERLNRFLAVSNPDVVASFADSLDAASLAQIEAIAARVEAVRRQRDEEHS